MKTILTNIILLCIGFSYAQVPPLEAHTWKLEKIVTVDSTLVVPSNIYFPGNFYDTFYIFGNCVTLGAETLYDNSNMAFNAIFPSYNFQVCPGEEELMDIEDFFMEEFFFIDTNQMTTHDPFAYQFTTTSDKIYLDITNNEGNVATFYDNFLSSEQFLEDNISIYPNPVTEVLSIVSNGIRIENINLYDLNGRLVKIYKLVNKKINLSNLQQGIYILEVQTSRGILREKLIKQ